VTGQPALAITFRDGTAGKRLKVRLAMRQSTFRSRQRSTSPRGGSCQRRSSRRSAQPALSSTSEASCTQFGQHLQQAGMLDDTFLFAHLAPTIFSKV
jgi:hypothetical protein